MARFTIFRPGSTIEKQNKDSIYCHLRENDPHGVARIDLQGISGASAMVSLAYDGTNIIVTLTDSYGAIQSISLSKKSLNED